MATDPITQLFTALGLSTLQSNVIAALLIGVTVTLSFLGYRFVKKTANRI